MKISAVSPVYNTNPVFLKKCIESMLNQTYKPYEIILVNDGSIRSETLRILDEYRNHELIKVIDQENKKTGGALNTGINAMTGDWWAGLSSDDRWYPHKLELQVKFCEEHPDAKVIYGDWDTIGEEDEIGNPHYKEPEFATLEQQQKYLIGSYFGMWSNMLVHKSVFDKVGGFNEEFIACEDYEMVIRISQYYKYYRVPEILTSYRIHPEQTTNGDYGFQGSIGRQYDARCHALAAKLFNK